MAEEKNIPIPHPAREYVRIFNTGDGLLLQLSNWHLSPHFTTTN